LTLLKPLYGLPDSGDCWHADLSRHFEKDLGMRCIVGDLSIFFKDSSGKLSGLTGTYVDDTLHIGLDEFRRLSQQISERFESREEELDNFTFAGISVQTTNGGFKLSQEKRWSACKSYPQRPRFVTLSQS